MPQWNKILMILIQMVKSRHLTDGLTMWQYRIPECLTRVERSLVTDDVYEDDVELYDRIDEVPEDDEMVNELIAVVRSHISEVYSPPRVTALAHSSWLENICPRHHC